MRLADLGAREPATPFGADGKIPWHEQDFSARMLREHLLQQHDRASRRFEKIDRHVAWLHDQVLGRQAARVIDLGCGPGFYTSRLARLGHECVGIDFSPASIDHAREAAEKDALSCEYRHQDVLDGSLGAGFDAVLMIFGEFNTFSAEDAGRILGQARRALVPDGVLVLEVHDEAFVRAIGEGPPSWFTAQQSVFSDMPHLCLKECAWHPEYRASTERHFVVPLSGDGCRPYVSTARAYSDAEYAALLNQAGFEIAERVDSLTGDSVGADPGLFVLVARGTGG